MADAAAAGAESGRSAMASRTSSIRVDVEGIPTDIVQIQYVDRIMIIVTQVGKVGTMIMAQRDNMFETKTTFSTRVLLGSREDPVPMVLARQLIELISVSSTLPLLLGVTLKSATPATIGAIVQAVKAQHVW